MTTKNDQLEVELWDIDRLVPYGKNAKRHPPEQIEKLAKAIVKFGWAQPIVVDDAGVIISGHGRRLAALKLDLKRVPVICRRDLSPEECDALRLADNRTVSNDYDTSLIQEELVKLSDLGFDMDSIGFDTKELEFLTADLEEFDESAFVDDISEAMREHTAVGEIKAREIDESTAPIGEYLGFKRVSTEHGRQIRAFMFRVETETGLEGADAFVAFISREAADHEELAEIESMAEDEALE